MAEITKEIIYRELLALDQRTITLEKLLSEIVRLARLTAREAEDGRKRIDQARAAYEAIARQDA